MSRSSCLSRSSRGLVVDVNVDLDEGWGSKLVGDKRVVVALSSKLVTAKGDPFNTALTF